MFPRIQAWIKYYSKFFFLYAIVSFISLAAIPILAMNPRSVKNARLVSSVLKDITRLIGIEWILRRGHILSESAGGVIVANHQSIIDVFGMFNIWDVMGEVACVAAKELIYIWPIGLMAYLVGVIFIDRTSPEDSYGKLKTAQRSIIRDKIKVWVFPEGKGNSGKGFLPFKRGAFKLAITTNVPIIPVVYSPHYFMNAEQYFFGKGRAIITCLDPIDTRNLTINDVDRVMETTREAMIRCYNDLREEVLSLQPRN